MPGRRESGASVEAMSDENPRVTKLPRGGVILDTKIGPVQFGLPPETIKDCMKLGLTVPKHFVVPETRFIQELGPSMGINVAEFEFPAYWNFFLKGRSCHLIVHNATAQQQICSVFQETLFGPEVIEVAYDYPPQVPLHKMPDLNAERNYFRKFGDKLMTIDMLLKFTRFENQQCELCDVDEDGVEQVVRIMHDFDLEGNLVYVVYEDGEVIAEVPGVVKIPEYKSKIARQPSVPIFQPPWFGLTCLGNSHGFDPVGRTSGYVLWINRRGIMIDPPTNSTALLLEHNIPPTLVTAVIITHCHADHDAGAFQKVLQEGRIVMLTTQLIMGSFLRKYSALSGLGMDLLRQTFQFRPVRIGEPIKMRGGEFKFFYTLHSIPCVGFEVFFGGKSIVFSADHMNDHSKIKSLYTEGVISSYRRDELLNFPWHHDVILHEAGVPPIHTPIDTLKNLEPDIKRRLYVVHVGATTIPEGSGLKRAPEGIENTIILDVDTPLYGPALDTLDLVTSIQLFQGLSMTHAREVLEMARREEYAPGDTIIREGEEGHFMMVIARGHAEVRVNKSHIRRVYDPPSSGSARSGADGKGDMTKQFHVGDYFGEQALVSPDCIRSATILAVSDVEVLRFDRQDFEWIFKGTEVFNRIRRMILAREAATWELLELNSMLAMLSSTQKTQLEQYLSRKRVTKDEVLWAAGEAPPGAIIIDRVPCKLIMNDGLSMVSEDDEPEFMTFRTGALLGEIDAIMDKSKSLSTCIAQGAGEVVFITSIDLFNFFTANPGVYFAVLGKHFVL